jgi:hypothetical protein
MNGPIEESQVPPITHFEEEMAYLHGRDASEQITTLKEGKANCEHSFAITKWDDPRFGKQRVIINSLGKYLTHTYVLVSCKHCGREKIFLSVKK